MKKKLLAFITVLIMTASLCACGGPSPTDTVTAFMDGIKTQDSEAIAAAYAGEEFAFSGVLELDEEGDESASDKVLTEQMMPMIMEFDYELANEVIDGDKATVDVTITTYSFGTAFNAFVTNYLTEAFAMAFSGASDEAIDAKGAELLSAELEKLTEKNTTKTATLSLTATEEGWAIDEIAEDAPFYDALTGGLMSTVEALDSAM
jgi:hypothetical protein